MAGWAPIEGCRLLAGHVRASSGYCSHKMKSVLNPAAAPSGLNFFAELRVALVVWAWHFAPWRFSPPLLLPSTPAQTSTQAQMQSFAILVALMLAWPAAACATPVRPVADPIRLQRRPHKGNQDGMCTGSWRSAAGGVCCPA
jgi:hypothetical protein